VDPASGTGVLIIAGVIVVIGIAAYFTWRSYCGMEVSTTSISLALYATSPLTATMRYKSWGFASWQNVGGTITAAVTGSAGASPLSFNATAAAATATITVTGAAIGSGTVRVSGTPSPGYPVSAVVDVNVSGD